ncbi:enoyl-ACP reductase [bacterium]|nr:enoyl-ACP reductase [bacterium]
MGLLDGKRGLIFGVANHRSIGWGIAERARKEGATLGFTYLNESLAKRVYPLAESLNSELILQCDVNNDAEIDSVFAEVQKRWGSLDFIVHSLAYASGDDLKNEFNQTSREGFSLAMQVSAYSLLALTNRAIPLMKEGGSILTLTYLGSEKVVPNYKVMGVAKAALEATVRELAVDVGPRGIRVNAVSAGPIKTLAASGISEFRQLLSHFEGRAPLKKPVTIEDVGAASIFYLCDLSAAVTGEITFVDCGFNVTAI